MTKTIGQRVEDHRIRKGWTMAEMGRRAGVSHGAIHKIVHDRRVKPGTMNKVLALLGEQASEMQIAIPADDETKRELVEVAAQMSPESAGIALRVLRAIPKMTNQGRKTLLNFAALFDELQNLPKNNEE